MSGVIDVPDDIFEQYQSKGQNRRKLLEIFIKTDGNKEWFTKHLFEAIRFECIQKGLMDSISRGALFSFSFSSQKTKKGAHYFVYTQFSIRKPFGYIQGIFPWFLLLFYIYVLNI